METDLQPEKELAPLAGPGEKFALGPVAVPPLPRDEPVPNVAVPVAPPVTATKVPAPTATALPTPPPVAATVATPAAPIVPVATIAATAPAMPPTKPVLKTTAKATDGELPEAYGTKKLFITARDPHWLYAHWDLTLAQQQGYNEESADGHLVLRVYAAKIEGHPLYEIQVHPESRHWFVHVERAGNSYCGELGYYSSVGKWTRIAASSSTITPPDAASPETDVEFATLPVELPFRKLIHIIEEAVRENLPLAQAVEELRRAGHPELPKFKTSSSHAAQTIPGPATPMIWTPQQEQALAKVISVDQSRRVWMGSLEITELIRRRLNQESASSPTSPMQGFGSPGLSAATVLTGVPSGTRDSAFSPGLGGGAGATSDTKGFWFTVNAELIVYGATEPGAKVSLGGHDIKLRPDGTFSYRFALPDGKYDLPAVAVSADGTDGRAADLTFNRETLYLGAVGSHPQDPALKSPSAGNLPGIL